MRTHAEWKVEIHMPSAACPTRWRTRSRISPAALFVNVIARIWLGHASRVSSREAMRRVSTLVLPEPAPATMSSAGPRYSTASRWRGLSPSSSADDTGTDEGCSSCVMMPSRVGARPDIGGPARRGGKRSGTSSATAAPSDP